MLGESAVPLKRERILLLGSNTNSTRFTWLTSWRQVPTETHTYRHTRQKQKETVPKKNDVTFNKIIFVLLPVINVTRLLYTFP